MLLVPVLTVNEGYRDPGGGTSTHGGVEGGLSREQGPTPSLGSHKL